MSESENSNHNRKDENPHVLKNKAWLKIQNSIKKEQKSYNYIYFESLLKEYEKKNFFEKFFDLHKKEVLIYAALLPLVFFIIYKYFDSYKQAVSEKIGNIFENEEKLNNKAILTFNQRKEFFLLPDKSEIVVFPNTSVVVGQYLYSKGRKITFDGSGYFIVKKFENLPFIIENKNYYLVANGAEFLIYSSRNFAYFYSFTGSFKIGTDEKNCTIEVPENRLLRMNILSDLGMVEFHVLNKRIKGLSNIIMSYQNASLYEVFFELEKNYAFKAIFRDENLKDIKVNGDFLLFNLVDFLEELQLKCGVKIERKGNFVYIDN